MDPVPDEISNPASADCATLLSQAERELKSLSYAISHDLRAPVRALIGFSQALKEHTAGTLDSTAAHFLTRIEESAQRLSSMIDGLLALARLSQADMQIVVIDIGTVCESINRELALQFPKHKPHVQIDNTAKVAGDPHLLRIALHALLHNAWKFTQGRNDASITVSAALQGDVVTLCIRDNGIGFEARYTDKLFVPFQHLQARNEQQGLGIGLASVQRIINRHGGTLHGEALAPGAAFFVSLKSVSN